MREWKVDGITFACIWLVAIIEAVEAAFHFAPNIKSMIPDILRVEYWAFLPLIMLGIAALSMVAHHFGWIGRENKSVASPLVSHMQPEKIAAKPSLRVVMLQSYIFNPEMPDRPDYTGFAVLTRVWNTGGDSVAISWRLAVIPKGAPPVFADCVNIPKDGLKLSGETGAIVSSTSQLDKQTSSAFVPRIPMEGNLLFYPRLKRSFVNSDTVLELYVTDIYGVESSHSKRIGDWFNG